MRQAVIAIALIGLVCCNVVAESPPAVLEAETKRIAVIEQLSRATVAVFDSKGQGGGSGVLITPDGYALTNFHVTAPCGVAMKCGLNDGKLYDAVLVGIDPPGDVALIKLLGRDDFPVAPLGDSDAARVGDSVIVAGNPFLLAEDYTPTITYGILSGTHRYQYPSGTLLEYADCLQTDASINPGNSGGPLFNAAGELIGINGRGSFEKRGRVNVGVGYAISINQIKLFMSHLRAGRLVDHATLGATVSSVGDDRVAVDDLLEGSDAYRRGLRYGDYLIRFGTRDITSANRLKNVLGIYPAGWKAPMEFVRDGEVLFANVRLATLHGQGELEALIEKETQNPVPIQPPGPKDKPNPDDEDAETPLPKLQDLLPSSDKPKLPAAIDKVYEKRSGFANYWFNRHEQERIAENCTQWMALASGESLVIEGSDSLDHPVHMELKQSTASYRSTRGQFFAKFDSLDTAGNGPPGSGGMLVAARQWFKLLSNGSDSFDEFYYLGQLPFGGGLELHDCIVAVEDGYSTQFYFSPQSGRLVGLEHFTADDLDPCSIQFGNFTKWKSFELPGAWMVRFGSNEYVEFGVNSYTQPKTESQGESDHADKPDANAGQGEAEDE